MIDQAERLKRQAASLLARAEAMEKDPTFPLGAKVTVKDGVKVPGKVRTGTVHKHNMGEIGVYFGGGKVSRADAWFLRDQLARTAP